MRRVRGTLNPALDIEGVLLTMCDERTNLGQLVARDVREFFQAKVFTTTIPRNVRLGEAPSYGMPAALYDAKSRGAAAYARSQRKCSRGPRMTPPSQRRATSDRTTPALGKGLSALIPDAPEVPRTGAIEVDVDLLVPNDHQPRILIDDGKLEELTASIRANGIIQPILVRRTGRNTESLLASGDGARRSAQGCLKCPLSCVICLLAPNSRCSSSPSWKISSGKI